MTENTLLNHQTSLFQQREVTRGDCMELINRRYQVIDIAHDGSSSLCYLVEDLLQEGREAVLRLIRPEAVSGKAIDYLKRELPALKNIAHPGLVRIFDFGIVQSIDGRSALSLQYYLAHERIPPYRSVLEEYAGKDTESIVKAIVDLCHALGHLHDNGYIYGCLGENTVSVVDGHDGPTVKLTRCVLNAEAEKGIFKPYEVDPQFASPEQIRNDPVGPASDLYSLGVLLLYMLTRDDPDTVTVSAALAKHRESQGLELFGPLIDRLIAPIEERYTDTRQVIAHINAIMSSDFPLFTKSTRDRVVANTKLVGRDHELDKLNEWKVRVLMKNRRPSLTLVDGTMGIGKTRLLRELCFHMELERVRVFTVSFSEARQIAFEPVTQFIRSIVPLASVESLRKYGPELIKVVPDILSGYDIQPTPALSAEREMLRLCDRLANFILDTFDKQRVVVVFDNAQWADRQSLQLIEHMLSSPKAVALWLILTYRSEEVDGKPLQGLLERWHSSAETTRLTLSPFTPEATYKLVVQLLGNSPILPRFSARIHRETEGNPLLIKDVVNALHSHGHLCIDDEGHWRTDFDVDGDTFKWPVPSNVYEAALNQVAGLPDDSRAVLETLSVFMSAAPLETVQEVCDIPRDRLIRILNELISLQLIDERDDDRGYTYEIRLRCVKRELYDFMEEPRKQELHNKVARALECSPNKDGTDLRHELVFHLKKAGELQLAFESALSTAQSLQEIGIDSRSQVFLTEAYEIAKRLGDDSQTTQILFLLSETYERLGLYEKALNAYRETLELASKTNDVRAKALAKQGIGLLQVRMNNIEAASDSLYEALDLAKSIGCTEAVLRATYSLCVMMLSKQRYDEIVELASKCLASYPDNEFLHIRGLLENLIGACYDAKGQSDEALVRFKESIRLFNLSGRYWEAARPINNIGNIYNDYVRMPEKARSYYQQAIDIVKKYGQPAIIETLLNNIGETYRAQDDHSKALEYYRAAEKLSLESGRLLPLLVCRVNMIYSCLFLGEYSMSCEYLRLTQAAIEERGDDFGKYAGAFYNHAATLFYVLGDFDKASYYLSAGNQTQVDAGSRRHLHLYRQALGLCVNHAKTGALDLAEVEAVIADHEKTVYVKDFRHWLHVLADLLIDAGELERAASLVSESERLTSRYDTPKLSAELLLLQGRLSQGNSAVRLICRSIERCKSIIDPMLEFEANKALGDALYSQGDLLRAAAAYASAADLLYRLARNVPQEYQRTFILSHNRQTVRERLLAIRRSILESECGLTLSEEGRDLHKESDTLTSFFGFMELFKRLSNEAACSLVMPSAGVVEWVVDLLDEMLDSPRSNHQYNVERILSVLAEIAAADTACVIEEDNGDVIPTYWVGTAPVAAELRPVLDQARLQSRGILIKEEPGDKHLRADLGLPEHIRAVICIPLFEGGIEDSSFKPDQRRSRPRLTRSILGYLYLSSSSAFSPFNEHTFRVCQGLAAVIRILIENRHLRLISSIDKVSGVYTRKYFEQAIANELHKAAREQYPLSLIMIDVDEFKNVNDTYGHQRGDEILRDIGRILLENIRPQDICCRYGGEEFAILLPDTSEAEAAVVAERLRTAVESAKLMGTSMPLTISLGIASYPTHGEWQDELVTRADQALYQAKQLGKNNTIVWDHSISGTAKRMDRLAGIVTGNTVQDQRNVLAIIEMIELIHQPIKREEKIHIILGRVISVLSAQLCSLVLVTDGDSSSAQVYTRKSQEEGWVSDVVCSQQIIDSVLSSGESTYCVDWDHVHGLDPVSGDPQWHSVIAVPIKRGDSILGALCLSASINYHEYGSSELNFAETLGKIISLVL